MQAAVFSDVDGTLVDGSLPKMVLAVGRRLGLYSAWQVAEIKALALMAKVAGNPLRRYALQRVYTRSTGGYTEFEVQQLIAELVPLVLAQVKAPVMAQLQEHQQAGRPVVLVSAGFHGAIAQLGAALGARGEGTKMHQRDGRYLSTLDGPVCQGLGKAARARTILAELGYDPAHSFAYGDTASDIPFLELFGHPCAVDPDPKLAEVAAQRGWPVLRTHKSSPHTA